MTKWTKESDWIPYFNALAQVVFWKEDLVKAEKSLAILESTGVYDSNSPEIILSKKEISVSKDGLRVAQEKLRDALGRITESDKKTWSDKPEYPKANN